MLAADLLDGKEREEEAAHDPEHDLDADQEREPFVNERCEPRDLHCISPVFVSALAVR